MPLLLLAKHALPEIQPEVPAKHWRLGDRGRAQSERLADALRPYSPSVVLTSEEPKAAETGAVVAARLGLPCVALPGLHEQDNTGTPYFETQAAFEAAVQTLFAEPGRRAYGRESADEALARFSVGLSEALGPYGEDNVVLVAHGRINTLFVAAHHPVEPFEFWKRWDLATFKVLSRPKYELLGPVTLSHSVRS